MGQAHFTQAHQYVTQLFGPGLVTQPNSCANLHHVAACPVNNFHVGKGSVWHGNYGSVPGAELYRTHTDHLHSPHVVAETTKITDTHRPVYVEDNAANEVLYRRSCRQGYREATDAKACDQRHQRYAEMVGAVKNDP